MCIRDRYFSEQNLGTIQAMLTTTIVDLEGYSMLAIEQMTSGVATVSYTHLDVYKRQTRALSNSRRITPANG